MIENLDRLLAKLEKMLVLEEIGEKVGKIKEEEKSGMHDSSFSPSQRFGDT